MSILSNTVSITQFDVLGVGHEGDFFGTICARLNEFGFKPIDNSAEELSLGWVELDDHRSAEFSSEDGFRRDNYLTFTLRRDQRKLPAVTVKAELETEKRKFLAENPTWSKVPKDKTEELKELVRARLLSRILPTPALFDVVWDTKTNRLSFTSLTPRNIDDFTDLFQKTFPGLRLVMVHPLARVKSIIPEILRQDLEATVMAIDGPVLEQIVANRWIGCDFMSWLLYRSMSGAASYVVDRGGPAIIGESFTAFLDNRLIFTGQGNEGAQKIMVAGPQDNFEEACAALRQGKEITEATIYFEKLEHLWRLTLKGELFQFSSFKCPTVRIEKGAELDDERQSIFYERMHVMSEGLQLFDSLLLEFLKVRLVANRWNTESQKMTGLLEG